MRSHNNKRLAYISLLIALALIFSYVESVIPIDFGISGVKLGLANIVSVIALYLLGTYSTLIIVVLRVMISGMLFGNMFSIIYSLAGGILSVTAMAFIKKNDRFSIVGVSMAGGVVHNIGQLFVAVLVIEQLKLYYYCPILIISGLVMGTIIGIVSSAVLKRVETYVRL